MSFRLSTLAFFLGFSAFLFTPNAVFAMSATNVQPANLIQNNRTTVTVTFTNGVSLPANGKVKIVFPAGFNVASASSGTCSTMNGGFTTGVSGQTVTITRDNSGTSEPVGAQSCTIALISNPSATGSTGTYTIQITDSVDAVLDQDAAVTADTIAVPGTIATANVQPANQVENVSNAQTVTFTSLNTLSNDGKISVTFPAGFVVDGANTPTCSSMDGGFSVSTSGQTVIISRNGVGTAQTAAAETCIFLGVKNPSAGTTTFYQIQTQDGLSNPTDATTTVFGDPFFTAPSLTATNVQPASLLAGASSIVTVTFTTVTSTPVGAKFRVTFPFDFSLTSATSVDCSTIVGSETFTTSSNSITIQTSHTTAEAAGAESCIISNVRNPRMSGSTGTYSIEVLDITTPGVLVSSDMAVAADTIAAGALTATDIVPENLVGSSTLMHIVQFTTVNPLPGNGKIKVTYPAGFSISPATTTTCSGLDGTFTTATSGQTIILTRVGGTSSTASVVVECMINDVRNATAVGLSGLYNVTTTNSLDVPIDWSTVAADTYVAPPALTLTNIQPVSLVQNVMTDQDINFTFSQNIPMGARFEFTYGAGFNTTGTVSVTCTGFDGGISTTTSGSVVSFVRSGTGTTVGSGARMCRVTGIRNPAGAGTTGTYSINIKDKVGFIMNTAASVTADTIIVPGALTGPDVTPATLVAGATTTATAVFGFANGWPYDAKLLVQFSPLFSNVTPTSVSCTGLSGGFLASASGTHGFVVTRDGSSTGTVSGTASCTLTSIKNPAQSGLDGGYTLVLYDSTNVTISSVAVGADTFIAGAISAANVQPDSLLANSTSTAAVSFTTTNVVPSNGKISVNFPAGFGLTGVGAADMACSGLNGALATSVAGQTVTAVRSGGTTTTESAVLTCTIANVRTPTSTGAGGTYIIRTLTSGDVIIDENTSVTSDTFLAAGTLTSTDVAPASSLINTLSIHTITFTQALGIPRDGSIRITYPSGFGLGSISSATCSSMDGSIASSVSGTIVILTRSGGTGEPGGAQTCTITSITGPSATGSGGTYTIGTYTAGGQLMEEDNAVSADFFSIASSGGGGGGGGGSIPTSAPTFQTSNDAVIRAQIEERLKTLPVAVHSLIKLPDDRNALTQEDSAVYYVGADGLRHAFPNSKVYFSWYCDFSGVQIVSPSVMASVGLGSNITYRPGTRLVKFITDPKVYLVTKGGILRAIPDEAFAIQLFGSTWNQHIDDISDAFYVNYIFGTPAVSASDFAPTTLMKSVTFPSDSLRIVGNVDSAPLSITPFCSGASVVPTTEASFTRPNEIPAGFAFTKNLERGSTPLTEVRYLQYILIELGTNIYPAQIANGMFGPATEQAVKNYQKANALPQTGKLDAATRAKLNELIK